MVALTFILLVGLASVINTDAACADKNQEYCNSGLNAHEFCNNDMNQKVCPMTCNSCNQEDVEQDICEDAHAPYCAMSTSSIGFCDIQSNKEEFCKKTCNGC